MKTKSVTRAAAGIFLLALAACNPHDANPTTTPADPDEGRYRENTFSWPRAGDALTKEGALAAISARRTDFATTEAWIAAVGATEAKLADKAFTDALWKPLDHACDELELAVWNEYGTARVGGSVVFDEEILKSRCRPSEETAESSSRPDEAAALAKASGWKWWSESEVVDRQHPYKMIGRSWNNFDLWAYKSTGGETQFEKRRSRFGVTAWYDTDASRIGVRIYLFDCGNAGGRKVCYYSTSWNSWYKDDDYVSKRDFAVGQVKINSNKLPVVRPATLRGSDGVLAMHSADHAGLQFRAYSSSGMQNTITDDFVMAEYVTW